MATNFYMYFIIGFISLFVGFVYCSPMLAGNTWMKENNFTEEDVQGETMVKILDLAYLCGVIISIFFAGFVIHQ